MSITRDQKRLKSPVLPYSGELARKALHVLTLAIPAGLLLLGKPLALPIVGALAIVAVATDVLRSRIEILNRFVVRVVGFMMRPVEQETGNGSARLNGATWVLVGATLCIALYPERVAAAALCMFLLGDAAAALIGRRWGRHAFPGSNKTAEGSLGFLVVALAVGLFLPGPTVLPGALGAVAAAGAEALPLRVNDNVTVPLLAGLVMALLTHAVPM